MEEDSNSVSAMSEIDIFSKEDYFFPHRSGGERLFQVFYIKLFNIKLFLEF